MGAAGCILADRVAANVVVKVGGAVLLLWVEIVAEAVAVGQGDHSGDPVGFISGDAHVQSVEDVGDVVVDVVGGAHCFALSVGCSVQLLCVAYILNYTISV